MMAERGIGLAHTTILRWVQRHVPEFEKRWNRYAWPVEDSWRVDETYLKVRGPPIPSANEGRFTGGFLGSGPRG
jgi:transposase-like protein